MDLAATLYYKLVCHCNCSRYVFSYDYYGSLR